ncbi:MAG: hypothetical protein FWC78_05470 [Defluviitaleaceae bacterium]|nr:hypothetical protein [Defluviitaleaceae bacterium]
MKRTIALIMVVVMMIGLPVILIAANNGNELNNAYDCCEMCMIAELPEADKVIHLGGDYYLIMERYDVPLEESRYFAIEPFVINCCANPIITISHQTFHTIRSHPLPHICVSRTIVRQDLCSICWSSHTTTSHLPGCGTACPVIG